MEGEDAMRTDKFHRFRKEFSSLSYSFENSPLCLKTTDTGPGPFYIPDAPERIDITAGEEGVGLLIGLKIVDAEKCEKIRGAKVEIWQANAWGRYSGFPSGAFRSEPTSPERWLRGVQESDNLGFVEFKTIYPGKYGNRTNHIHLKISHLSKTLFTQIFFPQPLNDLIATIPPYDRNPTGITNFNDPIIREFSGCPGCWPKVGSFGERYIATLTIGI